MVVTNIVPQKYSTSLLGTLLACTFFVPFEVEHSLVLTFSWNIPACRSLESQSRTCHAPFSGFSDALKWSLYQHGSLGGYDRQLILHWTCNSSKKQTMAVISATEIWGLFVTAALHSLCWLIYLGIPLGCSYYEFRLPPCEWFINTFFLLTQCSGQKANFSVVFLGCKEGFSPTPIPF